MLQALTPELVVLAYQSGYFPMAEEDSGEIYWYSPDPRAVIPLDNVRVSRSLRRTIRKCVFRITVNSAFGEVIRSCAARSDTWISDEIIAVYEELHKQGFAHSVEAWDPQGLVGGLYGVSLGGAFFGESMFSRATDASKTAFVALTERLKERGFTLLDSQFLNPHMQSLGAVEIPRSEYLEALERTLPLTCRFQDD